MEYIVFIVIFLVVGFFLMHMGRGLVEWLRNNSLPVLSVPARIVSKRTDTEGGQNSRVYTTYYTTFELANGARLEFTLNGNAFGLLVEGDRGTLTYQGTRYHGFQREH